MALPVPTFPAVLATLPDYPSWNESIIFQLTGLAVVFGALATIWGMMELVGFCFKRAAVSSVLPGHPPQGVPSTSRSPELRDGPSPEVVAVIVAALHCVLGDTHRIVKVQAAEPVVDWAREGRRQIFQSHNVR